MKLFRLSLNQIRADFLSTGAALGVVASIHEWRYGGPPEVLRGALGEQVLRCGLRATLSIY